MTATASLEAAPPRRLTASRLFGALTRQPRFRDAMAIQRVVPYGAMMVLKAVCQAIVDSPELGFYRPPHRLRDEVEVAIASRLGRYGAEEQVSSDLDALIEAGMVVEADGAWTVPVDLPALLQGLQQPGTRSMARPIGRWTEQELTDLSARQRSAIINGHKGGRPRKRVEGQRELAVHRVVAGNPDVPRGPRGETQEGTHTETQGVVGFVENPNEALAGLLGSSLLAAASPSKEIDSIHFEGEQQLGGTEPTDARGKPTLGFDGNPRAETHGAETQGETQARETQAEPPAPSSDERQKQAHLLALAISEATGVDGKKGSAGAEKAAEWLSFPGMNKARILEIVRDCKRRHDARPQQPAIGSFNYFDDAIREAAGLPKMRPPTPERDGNAGLVDVKGFKFEAHVNLKGVEEMALGPLSGGLTLAREGNDASLSGSVGRLSAYPVAMAVFRREVPDLDARIARSAGPRRAAG